MDPDVSVDPVEECIDKIPDNPVTINLPQGKSEFMSSDALDVKFSDDSSIEVQLAIEYAELEVKAAEAMQRAALAKKEALDVIRASKGVVCSSDVNKTLDSVVRTNMTVKEPIATTSVRSVETDVCSQDRSFNGHTSDSMLERLLTKLELPKCEMPLFDGSSSKYIRFFRQFDEQIERHLSNDGQRLNYLYHYCTGKAKEAIEGCLMYPADEGYTNARRILHELFGQRHYIVRAMLDEVTDSNLIKSDAGGLSTFANQLTNCADALEQLNYTADLNSVTTIERVLLKLPRFMMNDWVKKTEEIYARGREPVFRDVSEFVLSKAKFARNRYSHLLHERSAISSQVSGRTNVQSNTRMGRSFALSSSERSCPMCNATHELNNCAQFKALSVKERWHTAIKNGTCFLCLRYGHQARLCKSTARCSIDGCKKEHHYLLHQCSTEVINLSCKDKASHGVSLGVIPVKIVGRGTHIVSYAMLDSGSDTSLISYSLAEKLGVSGQPRQLKIATALGIKRQECVEFPLTIMSMDGLETIDIPKVYSVSQVLPYKVKMPNEDKIASWKHLTDVPFESFGSVVIDLLIGLDVPEAHWIFEQRRGRRKEPHADRTLLGWVLRGPVDLIGSDCRRSFAITTFNDDIPMNLQRLYDNEFADVDSFKKALSKEDELAVTLVEQSLNIVDGHFCVGLPWKSEREQVMCPNSVAVHRLAALKKRLITNQGMREKYKDVIQRYIDKGFAIMVPERCKSSIGPKWYLPHHAVMNPMKPDKLRVVFDCAATYKGVSLNHNLLQGPNMIQSLVGVLIRFRQHSVAIAADIEDMFLQVKVPIVDQGALRFLWWPNGDIDSDVREYQLTVHPFGAVSSPFCANFALRKTATLYGSDYPSNVSEAVLRHFYVDDCLLSVCNENEANVLVGNLESLLSKTGFRLTKWISNRRNVLREISENERAVSVRDLSVEKLPMERTLGMMWDVQDDHILYRVNLKHVPATKRGVLSQLASLYDPLGLIGPLALPAKFILQTLCRKGYGWDEPIEGDELASWNLWKENIVKLRELRIPRWYQSNSQFTLLELHIFCDASEVGYGAVAYLRFVCDNYSHCCMILAKSRVAPLKQITIPRLELSAGVVASDIYRIIKEELDLPIDSVYFWTDSTIVLYYLQNETTRYATFVANRVARILSVTRNSQWGHVEGKQNPADFASRGMNFNMEELDRWFYGPPFLKGTNKVAKQESICGVPVSQLEMKAVAHVNITIQDSTECKLFERFSSWMKLIKCVVWLTRFKLYLLVLIGNRVDISVRLGQIKVDEHRLASQDIVRMVQKECFSFEMELLRREQLSVVSRTNHNRLRKLSPILIDGLLCVGGRLQWSTWAKAAKHPMILPNRHVVTELIVQHYHEIEGHIGATQVLSAIRKKYWILQGGTAVRRVVSKCMKCRRFLCRPCTQVMAPLPSIRIESTGFAFDAVGVDYFGPIYVKRGRVDEKRYGCLFTCLNIRAVHIEVAHSMSTDSFLQVLSRFIARRGQPRVIYSDNGSNFKGAQSEMKFCLENWSQLKIRDYLRTREIEWNFTPPEASHWGGVWERIIRSVKNILNITTRGQRLTDETLDTFLCEAERILNDRPLVPLDDDTESLEVLTPNKFLLLRDNTVFTDGLSFPRLCIRTWRKVQLLANTFWKRWKMEYLPTLQIRHKWHLGDRNLKIGDVVLVKRENTHRNQWPLGLITEAVEGGDGKVREVIVKTSNGKLRRDVRKLCLIEGVE